MATGADLSLDSTEGIRYSDNGSRSVTGEEISWWQREQICHYRGDWVVTSGDRSVTTEGRRGFDSDNGGQICHNRGDLVVTTGADLSLPKGFGKPFAVYRFTENLGHIQLQMTGSGKPSECKPRRNQRIISRNLMRKIPP